jgi:general stress protein 26
MQSNDQSLRQDSSSKEVIAKLKAMAEDARNCMFTKQVDLHPHTTRAMSLQKVEADGSLWFISTTDSFKNADLQIDPRVTLYFQKYRKLMMNKAWKICTIRHSKKKKQQWHCFF